MSVTAIHVSDSTANHMTHACGAKLLWRLHYNGVQEFPLFAALDGTAVRRCPQCDVRLTWPTLQEQGK